MHGRTLKGASQFVVSNTDDREKYLFLWKTPGHSLKIPINYNHTKISKRASVLLAHIAVISRYFGKNSVKTQLISLLRTLIALFTAHIVNTHYGDYGNSLSRIFGKNFVKVTVLLDKLLKLI